MAKVDPSEILVATKPPLTKKIVNNMQQTIEHALAVALTNQQQEIFQTALTKEWQKSEASRKGIRQTVRQFDEMEREIAAMPPLRQPLAWQELGRQLYMYAEREGKDDPVGQLIINTFQTKNRLLVAGTPPLSQQAAESYTEMSLFIEEITIKRRRTFTAEQREEVITELTKLFPTFPKEIKEEISQADTNWKLLRENWQQASEQDRMQFSTELIKHKIRPQSGAEGQKSIGELAQELITEYLADAQTSLAPPAEGETVAEMGQDSPALDSSEVPIQEVTQKTTQAVDETKREESEPLDVKELVTNNSFLAAVKRLRERVGKNRPFPLAKKQ